MNKFLFLSLVFFVLLIFLGYPEVSFAATASVKTGTAGAGLITANATGTVISIDNDVACSGVGFVYGTASATFGNYAATSSLFGSYTTSTDFNITLSSLTRGTVYYHRAYCTTTVSGVYGDQTTFLTGVDAPSGFTTQSLEDRIKLTWTAGSGSEKTMIRYNDGTTYPTLITEGNQAFWATGTEVTLYDLPKEHTYYFSAWSSTSDASLTTTSASYLTIKAATTAAVGGGVSRTPPTTYSDSLVINARATTAKSREVTLTLKAGDVSLMTICNRSDLLNCPLENYAVSKPWTLTEGDGVKTVYAKFVSPDGLNSDAVFGTIILDTSTPTPTPTPVPMPTPEPTPAPTPAPVEKPISEMTEEELTAKIAEIMAQVKALQVQLAELKGVIILEVNLKYGDRGDDVIKLQEILIEEGLLAESFNTGWFGSLTKAAVIKFQEKYTQDVLAPLGLIRGTGFVGLSTRTKLNELLGK